MKLPAQILLLLALFSLLSLTFSQPVTISSENEESGETSTTETSTTTSTTETSTTVGGDLFTACDPSNRPQICTLEYAPVCGYIIGCVGGNCTATFGNDCGACGDAAVSGYVNGACEDAQTTCDPHNRPQICPLIFTATCAVASNCRGLNCFANASSSCNACSMTGVGYSLPGVCPGPDLNDVLQNCDPNNRPLICTADWNPVCAHLNNCVGRNCWSTAGNACSACADGNVDTYLVGDCPEFGTNNEEGFINEEEGFITEEAEGARTDCDASNRPTVCTADFTPVCAHTSGCEGDFADCTRTEANGCSACSQENVDYYYDGQCPF